LAALIPNNGDCSQIINQLKINFSKQLEACKEQLENVVLAARLASECIDVSLPGRGQSVAGLHPVTTTLRRISRIFASVGFKVVERA